MATTNNKKQRLIIQDCLASPEIYTRVSAILEPSYFDAEFVKVVQYIRDYYERYRAIPQRDMVEAETNVEINETGRITKDRIESMCDDIERFCRESAVKEAIYTSIPLIEKDEMGKMLDLISKAVTVSLQKDLGINIFEDPEKRLLSLIESFTPISTGIAGIDVPLNGGLTRKQLTLITANSGRGKSLIMQNIGVNFAAQGYNVLFLTLELPEDMVFLRLGSIISGVDAKEWKEHIPEISGAMLEMNDTVGEGSYRIKRIPQHSNASDIRSYLSFYEVEYECFPDVIILDYLDLMDPNMGVSGIGIHEQDKRKAEEFVEILHDYNAVGLTAAAQNRGALAAATPDQSVIAGGISKINTADNHIALIMSDEQRLEGTMFAHFLKTRSASGVGQTSMLSFDPKSLVISDPESGGQTSVMPKARRQKKNDDEPILGGLTIDVVGLPGIEDKAPAIVKELPAALFEVEDIDIPDNLPTTVDEEKVTTAFTEKNTVTKQDADNLIKFMGTI